MVTYESNPLHKHIRFRCFSPSNPEFIGSLEPEPSSEKERKMITYYIISGEEAVKNKQPELMNQCNQSPNGPIFGVVKIQNLTLFLTIRVKNWVQLTCQCHRFCLNLHILFSFNGLTTNKRNILGTKITLGGVLKISENYQSYSTKHPPLPDMSSKTIQSNGISRSEFKREAWNMGDLVKNEKKKRFLPPDQRTEKRAGNPSRFNKQYAWRFRSIDARLHQLLVGKILSNLEHFSATRARKCPFQRPEEGFPSWKKQISWE